MPLFIEFKYINKLIYDDFYDHYSNNYTDTFKKYHDIAYFQHILYIYSDINNKLLTDVDYYGLDNEITIDDCLKSDNKTIYSKSSFEELYNDIDILCNLLFFLVH